jgi:RHS repeat-associated protein
VVYDPFGNLVTETNATNGDRFKFAGMEYDSATGLYYDHARYYDATIGRFVSQDPIAFEAGDTNRYRYVQNCPTTQADTSGEAEHEKGARQSTSNDHDYGQSRQKQDKNSRKPNHRSYKRYTDPKPPSGPQQEGPKVHVNKYPQGTDGGDNPPNRGGTPPDGGDGGYYTIIAGSGLIFAGAVLAAGTIVEDIITFGGGIIDDPPSFAAAGIMVAKGGQMLLR